MERVRELMLYSPNDPSLPYLFPLRHVSDFDFSGITQERY